MKSKEYTLAKNLCFFGIRLLAALKIKNALHFSNQFNGDAKSRAREKAWLCGEIEGNMGFLYCMTVLDVHHLTPAEIDFLLEELPWDAQGVKWREMEAWTKKHLLRT